MSIPTLGSRIRRARVAANMGVRELARAAGKSAPWLSRLERGEDTRASAATLQTLARLLRIDPDALLLAGGKVPLDVLRALQGNPGLSEMVRLWAAKEKPR